LFTSVCGHGDSGDLGFHSGAAGGIGMEPHTPVVDTQEVTVLPEHKGAMSSKENHNTENGIPPNKNNYLRK